MLAAVTLEAPSAAAVDSQSNPFDELRPVLRSEEDDIRKGIFSTALKRLRTIGPEEKIEWCVAIHEATSPKPCNTAATTTATATTATAGVKRTRESPDGRPEGESHEADDEVCVEETDEKTKVSPAEQQLAAVRAFSPEEASEFVAAFMRAQLDKVVGGSLNNLAVAALRVLCLMLGIVTRARGKDALYNTLASYYYTHCEKLGKRVSRDTFAKNLAQQDAEMLNRLMPASKPHKASTPTTVSSSTASSGGRAEKPAKATNDENVPSRRQTPASRASVTVKGSMAPLPASLAKASSSRTKDNRRATALSARDTTSTQSETETNELHIDYGSRVFAHADHTSGTRALPCNNATSDDAETTLCGVALERKVASIIQLYDPVTVDIIVKKLAQIGFRPANATRVVDDILRTFHQKQLIFFDSGIAYMM